MNNLVNYANNPNIAAHLTDAFPHPYTEADGLNFITRATQEKPENVLAIDHDGKAIGSIGIYPQNDVHAGNAELGYWLAEPYWGMGITTQAIQLMVAYTFSRFLVRRIFARPFSLNQASHRVLEKNGFQLEARFQGTIVKNGELLDELVYAVRR